MSNRPYVLPCRGRSPKTGKPVGSRHRWSAGWGKGTCLYCHRTLDEVLDHKSSKPAGRDLVCSRENLIASLRTMTTLMTDVELFPESVTVTKTRRT